MPINIPKSSFRAVLSSAIISLPLGSCTRHVNNGINQAISQDTVVTLAQKAQATGGALVSDLVSGLKDTTSVNMRGGVTNSFTDSSLNVLRQRMLAQNIKERYSFPIDTAYKPYISGWGIFGAPRGSKRHQRPHLGVDIYTTKAGKKPVEPVAILSPIDGIVVSEKEANNKDKVVGNIVKIMGTDGKIYSFDHMAKHSDYPQFREIEMKKPGTLVKCKDTLGILGNTGETAVWHLHISVQDLDVEKQQKQNPVWMQLFQKFQDYARPEGQVNPLDSVKAGPISSLLKQYKVGTGPVVPYAKFL